MLPHTRTVALGLILVTTALVSAFFTSHYEAETPARAVIADVYYSVGLNVTVTDDAGRLVFDALVYIQDNTSSPWTTDGNGYIVIAGLADNVSFYTLWASKSGYLSSINTDVNILANQTTNVTLVLTGGMIYGIAKSPLGYIEDAIVSATPVSGPTYVANVSSVDGTYALGGLPSGVYNIEASSPGYDSGYKNGTTVTAGMSLRLDFVLYSKLGYISGFVLHSGTGLPLNNTNITYTVGDITSSVPNGDDGSYLVSNLTAGTYSLTATKDGYFPVTITGIVVIRGNLTGNVNFTLTEKPTKIFGTVKSGTYLQPKVNVSVVGTTYFNISDVEGDYSIENLTAGTYTLSAQLEGYALAQVQNVVLPVGGQVRIDIELVALPGAIVRGDVLAKDTGDPLIYVSVTIIGPDGRQFTKETNFRGQFEFTMLSDGNYTLQFEVAGYRPLEVSRVVVRSDTVNNDTYYLEPVREGFTGFIFGFDLAHSMMILALFVTILILAVAVYLRIRTFQAPESAPAVYDQAEEEEKEQKELSPAQEKGEVADQNRRKKLRRGGNKSPPET